MLFFDIPTNQCIRHIIFMSEFSLHAAQLLKKYSPKKWHFLGGIGVVYNYITRWRN